MEKLRKITALFLAAALLLPLLPGAAWATEVTEETFVVEAAAEEAATKENTDEAQETSPESSVSVETEDDVASETETAAEPAVVSEEDISTASTEASGKCGASLTWTLDSDGTLTISGSGTMYDFNDYEGDDTSPWHDYSGSITAIVIGDSVTGIGEYAFQSLACVTSATIGSGVKTIGGGAFIGCENVKSIKIPDSVTSIGDYAFAVCNAMTKLTIGSSVKTIGEGAFSRCRKLTSVTIPNSATSIGEYAFDECIRLSSVTIGSGVTKIGERAFSNCLKLSGVTIPATVTSIGDNAFGYLSLDEMYDFEDVDVPAHGSLDDYGYATITGFTIKGYSGSAAQAYAKEWGLTFVALDSDALSTPTVTLANVSSGIKVSWGKVSGATKYRVYRKASGDSSWTDLGYTTSTSYTDTDVKSKSGTTYYYTVRAYSDSSYSSYETNKSIVRLTQPSVTLANASTGVKISWGKVTGAAGYYIYRKTSGGSFSRIATITSGSTVTYTDTTAKDGTTYYYGVRAYKGSSYSSYVTSKNIDRLAQPTVTLANVSTGVKVSWDKVSGATKYRVYRKASGDSSWTDLGYTTSTSYTDTAVKSKSGTTYYYTARAYSDSSYSSYVTNKSIVRLVQPTVTLANASTGVKVSWDKVSGAAGYYIYRKTSGGSFSRIATVTSGSTVTYTDTTAKDGTTYYYGVRAYKGSSYSSYVTSKTIVRLATPTLSSVASNASGKMTVKWTAVSGVTGYLVQYSTSSSFSSCTTVKVTGATSTGKTITGLTAGTTYYVRIRTYKTVSGTNYYSGWSSKKSVAISK